MLDFDETFIVFAIVIAAVLAAGQWDAIELGYEVHVSAPRFVLFTRGTIDIRSPSVII